MQHCTAPSPAPRHAERLAQMAHLADCGARGFRGNVALSSMVRLPRQQRVQAALEVVRKSVSYRGEATEVLTPAAVTLDRGYGDCTDMAILLGALLRAVGVPVRLRLLRKPNEAKATHVAAEALSELGAWQLLDPTPQPAWRWVPVTQPPPAAVGA